MALAANKIQIGETDIAIAGGADIFNELCYSIFYSLGILSETSSSPFMKNRDGITIGEGAGFLVIESIESAQKRGANILAEFSGYDMSCDAYHLTTPNPEGYEAVKAMIAAIKNSGLETSDIDCISPHATGTHANDLQEASAIYKVFGKKAGSSIPISATKSVLGHCMGAASALEAIISILAINNNQIPETLNPNNDTCEYDLNICNFSKPTNINNVLSNSFAFGGNICCVILSKYKL
jgi:3-oxoacyl-[acyl-carrier-protein] synthase II